MKTCPWCELEIEPLYTAEHRDEACFQHSRGNDKDVSRNPLMCPECKGVFGFEDVAA